MKIKISEEQANRLILIKEDGDGLAQFEAFCKAKAQEVNKVYSKLIYVTVDEILKNEVNISQLNKYVDNIEDQLHVGNNRAYAYIEGRPEEDLDMRIDRAYDTVSDKIASIQIVILHLEKLQELSLEHKLPESFSDVQPIDITSKQL